MNECSCTGLSSLKRMMDLTHMILDDQKGSWVILCINDIHLNPKLQEHLRIKYKINMPVMELNPLYNCKYNVPEQESDNILCNNNINNFNLIFLILNLGPVIM